MSRPFYGSLASSRRDAQKLLETGKSISYRPRAIRQRLGAWYACCGLVEQYRAQLREASTLQLARRPWIDGIILPTSDGCRCLSGSRPSWFARKTEQSRQFLLAPSVADNPQLSSRRQELFAGQAILLEFLDGADLFVIDSESELAVNNNRLTGPSTSRWTCSVQLAERVGKLSPASQAKLSTARTKRRRSN